MGIFFGGEFLLFDSPGVGLLVQCGQGRRCYPDGPGLTDTRFLDNF